MHSNNSHFVNMSNNYHMTTKILGDFLKHVDSAQELFDVFGQELSLSLCLKFIMMLDADEKGSSKYKINFKHLLWIVDRQRWEYTLRFSKMLFNDDLKKSILPI